jgi:uncharacterized protein YbjT (DUF2867 family)
MLAMRILICGASGFIGRHVARALAQRGHEVLHGVRDPVQHSALDANAVVKIDFAHDWTVEPWLEKLRGVDVVINAIGIMREDASASFEALHVKGPTALFDACVACGVKRVIQISALGADKGAETAYHRSKRAADEHLLSLPLNSVVVQPSLVFGRDGESSRLFMTLASMPLIPLPAQGEQMIQPVHIDDVVQGLVCLVEGDGHAGERLTFVGPHPASFRRYLAMLRQAMGLGHARFVSVPEPLVAVAIRWSGGWRGALVDEDSWRMLKRGNTGDASAFTSLLGHPPMPVDHFVGQHDRQTVKAWAVLGWVLPLFRMTLAFVWFASGLVSMGVFPIESSLAMLARVGIGSGLAPLALYGAAGLDVVMGVATLAWPRKRLWLAQIALVLGYTAIITVCLPEQWLHPFGPVVKNAPFLALLMALHALEDRR